MNFIYRNKYNWRTGCRVAVSELCNRAGKKTGHLIRLPMLVAGMLLSSTAWPSAVNDQFNYQTYMDFASNRGVFVPGKTNIPFFTKLDIQQGKSTPTFILKYPMPDFSAVDSVYQANTLVAPSYVVSAAHIAFDENGQQTDGKDQYKNIRFGDNYAYHTVAFNHYPDKDKSVDLVIPRLNKYVTEAVPVPMLQDLFSSKQESGLPNDTAENKRINRELNNVENAKINKILQNKERFPIAVHVGTGTQRIYQATIDASGRMSLFGVDALDTSIRHDSAGTNLNSVRHSTVIMDAFVYPTGGILDLTDAGQGVEDKQPPHIHYPVIKGEEGEHAGFRIPQGNTFYYGTEVAALPDSGAVTANFPYFNNVPYSLGDHGDSGSPLFLWDTESQKWVLIGVVNSGTFAGNRSMQIWSVVDQGMVQPVIDTDTDNIDLAGDTAEWQPYKKESKSYIVDNNNGKSTEWHGTALAPPEINETVTVPNAELAKTKHINFTGGGTLVLDSSINQGAGGLNFDKNQQYTFSQKAGNSDIYWQGAGLNIGQGTTVNWNVGGVSNDELHKIGAGTLIVGVANQGGLRLGDGSVLLNTTGQTFVGDVVLTSGRGTLKLNKQGELSAEQLYFAVGGGTLDLNGTNMTFSKINALDADAIITNSNASTSSLNLRPTKDYLYPGKFTGNLHISNTTTNKIIFNGNIDSTTATMQQTGGALLFQGQPVLHARPETNYKTQQLNERIAQNNKNNENAAYAAIQQDPGFNLPDTVVTEQQSFDQPDWDSRNFKLKAMTINNAQLGVARNSTLNTDLALDNSQFTVGEKTVYIDRNTTVGKESFEKDGINYYNITYDNVLVSGESIASNDADKAHFQGSIDAKNSTTVTLQNSMTEALINADSTSSVNIDQASWLMTGNSTISGGLTLANNSSITLSAYNNAANGLQNWQPHTLTVANLTSSNNTFSLAVDPQRGMNDAIKVTKKATGKDNKLGLSFFLNSPADDVSALPAKKMVLASIANPQTDFFKPQTIYQGFKEYTPNLETNTPATGGVEWVLAPLTPENPPQESPPKGNLAEGKPQPSGSETGASSPGTSQPLASGSAEIPTAADAGADASPAESAPPSNEGNQGTLVSNPPSAIITEPKQPPAAPATPSVEGDQGNQGTLVSNPPSAIITEPKQPPAAPVTPSGSDNSELAGNNINSPEYKLFKQYFIETKNVMLMDKMNEVVKTPQIAFISESNQLDKRLGDIRHLQQDTGFWIKTIAGKGSYNSMQLHYTTMQLGADTKRGNHFYGIMASYTQGKSHDYSTAVRLDESHKTGGVGLYYSWVPDSGLYIDVIGKYLRNNQQLAMSVIEPQSPTSNIVMGSVQLGYRAQFAQINSFIEPSVELLAGHISGYNITGNNIRVNLANGNPMYAKLGFSAGKQWQNSQQQNISVSFGIFRLQNLQRNGTVTLQSRTSSLADWQTDLRTRAAADNRFQANIGVNAQFSANWRLYMRGETNFGGAYRDVSGQIGVRYQF